MIITQRSIRCEEGVMHAVEKGEGCHSDSEHEGGGVCME